MKVKLYLQPKDCKSIVIDAIEKIGNDKALTVTIETETRTLAQNRAQWTILQAFSSQILWPINGVLQYISSEDWKDVLSSAYKKEVSRVATGFDSGVVMLGQRTKEFKKEEWGEWMSFLDWAAAEKGVRIPMSKNRVEELGL